MPQNSIAPFKDSHLSVSPGRASEANRMLKNIGIPWRLPMESAQDIAVVESTPSTLGDSVLTVQALDLAGSWDNSAAAGSKFTIDTTDFNDADAADAPLLPATEEDELDFFLMGQLLPFFGLQITIATPGAGGALAWEYLNTRGNWVALPAGRFYDGSVSLTSLTDVTYLVFSPPDDWGPMASDNDGVIAEVNTEVGDNAPARYYLRARVTTVFATNPVADQIQALGLLASAVAQGFPAPATGLVDYATLFSDTAGGGNIDVIVLMVNHTQKKRGLFTFNVTALSVDRVAATLACYVKRGDICTFHVLQEDGTTEPTNVRLTPEIAI